MKKHINRLTYTAILLFLGVLGVSAQTSGLWRYGDVKMDRSSDGRHLDLSYKLFPTGELKSQEIIYLFPVLVGEGGSPRVELDPVVFAGGKRYRVLERRALYRNPDKDLPQVAMEHIQRAEEVPAEGVEVSRSFPFERWMRTASLEIREQVYGCASCGISEGMTNLIRVNIPMFTAEDYEYHFYEPAAVAQKRYEEQFESKVNFVVARHELKREYKNNADELDRLDAFVSNALTLTGATLDQVLVEGYASPEGGFEYNKALAGRRANTLAEYVKSKHPNVRKAPAFRVVGVGEDWAGLRKAVEASSMAYKEEVLAAIDGHSTDVKREAEIKRLDGGKVYRYLLDNLYPPLRRTTFRMGYEVRPYTLEELPEVFGKNPALMSHHELYLLADLYAKEGKNPLPVYENAYNRFAADPIAALNYANALLRFGGDAEKALGVLQPIMSDARALFPMAIAYHMKGDEMMAEDMLQKAADAGVEKAKAFVVPEK